MSKEADLITQFKRDLVEHQKRRGNSLFWHKLADVPLNAFVQTLKTTLCAGCLAKVRQKTSLFAYQGGKSPFDAICLLEGTPIAMEFKVHQTHTAFLLNRVAPHQEEHLRTFDEALGLAFIMVFVEHEPHKVSWVIPQFWVGPTGLAQYLAVIPIRCWLKLKVDVRKEKRSSIPLSSFWSDKIGLIGRETAARGRRQWDIETLEEVIGRYVEEPGESEVKQLGRKHE